MLDKELFFSLCEKYNVELSKTAKTPMIRDAEGACNYRGRCKTDFDAASEVF